MMSGLIFGGVLIVGGCAWWLSHSFDLEPSHKSFYAADDWPEPSDERIKEVVKLSIESMLRFLGIKPPSV